jgi:hypothetical protein
VRVKYEELSGDALALAAVAAASWVGVTALAAAAAALWTTKREADLQKLRTSSSVR